MKHYFISDVHLGTKIIQDNEAHERKFIQWLEWVASDAKVIYLLGDIFDFWFEFPRAVQTEYQATLDALRSITKQGVEVHFFCGNHDQWTFGHLEEYCGMVVHRRAEVVNIDGVDFFLAHGHGLGENRLKVKLLNALFESKVAQFVFRHTVPARWAWRFGSKWSASNRNKLNGQEPRWWGEDKENQAMYAKNHSLANPNVKFYIMGHRHIDHHLQFANKAQLMLIGDFYRLCTYAVWDGESLQLMDYDLGDI